MKSQSIIQYQIECPHQLVLSTSHNDQLEELYRCIRCRQAFKVHLVSSKKKL